jgi:hypothetical protein
MWLHESRDEQKLKKRFFQNYKKMNFSKIKKKLNFSRIKKMIFFRIFDPVQHKPTDGSFTGFKLL